MDVPATDHAPDREIAQLVFDHGVRCTRSLTYRIGLDIKGNQANVGTRKKFVSLSVRWLAILMD